MHLLLIAVLVPLASATSWKTRQAGQLETYDWESYKLRYGKQYVSKLDDETRRVRYLGSVAAVNQHNVEYDQGRQTYWKGINKFSDMTEDEIKQYMGLIVPENVEEQRSKYPKKHMQTTAPASIDWRNKGAVLHVKDQGQCGSCWAFATAAALEGRHFIKNTHLPDIAEQQVVSCSGEEYDTFGCNGGWYDGAWKYIRDNAENGIDTQQSYPYTAMDDVCETEKTKDGENVAATCEGPGYTETTEAAVMEAVGNDGPLAIAVDCMPWKDYSGGIFEDPECKDHPGHAVTIVGYDDVEKYWIIKNSWGPDWGDRGYVRLRKDYTDLEFGMCGLAHYAYYPMV